MAARLSKLPHVKAVSPALYSEVFLTGPLQSTGALLKGIDPNAELGISDTLRHLKAGSLDRLRDPDADPPGIILGARLVEDTGMILNSIVNVVSPQGELTPIGVRPAIRKFKVVGIFETGFFEIDDKWAFTSIHAEQRFLHIDDQVNQIELNVDNLDNAPQIAKEIEKVVGPRYTTTTWLERNKQLLGALQHGAGGHDHHDRADRAGGGAQHFHHAGDDGDGEVPGYRGADVDGRAAVADPADLHAAGRADRDCGQRDRADGGIHGSATSPRNTSGRRSTRRCTR